MFATPNFVLLGEILLELKLWLNIQREDGSGTRGLAAQVKNNEEVFNEARRRR